MSVALESFRSHVCRISGFGKKTQAFLVVCARLIRTMYHNSEVGGPKDGNVNNVTQYRESSNGRDVWEVNDCCEHPQTDHTLDSQKGKKKQLNTFLEQTSYECLDCLAWPTEGEKIRCFISEVTNKLPLKLGEVEAIGSDCDLLMYGFGADAMLMPVAIVGYQ